MLGRPFLAAAALVVTPAAALLGAWAARALAAPVAPGPQPAPLAADPPAPQSLAANPGSAADFYNRGLEALHADDPRKAIGLLRKCLAQERLNCLCNRALGVAYSHPRAPNGRNAVTFLQAYVDYCPDAKDAEQVRGLLASQPPRTPKGLERCTRQVLPTAPMPRHVGETIRYHVDINGLSMGKVDFQIVRAGRFEGQTVTEYRSEFSIDSLVGSFLPVNGRAASLVPTDAYVPLRSMTRFAIRGDDFSEDLVFANAGKTLTTDRNFKGEVSKRQRRYPTPSVDFLTAFYGLRALPRGVQGCATFFGNGRAHTVWLTPQGEEKVKTPIGLQPTDKVHLAYASEVSPRAYEADVWLAQTPDRIPYRAILFGPDTMEAQVHTYQPGSAE